MKAEIIPPTAEPDVQVTMPLSVANRLAVLLGFTVDPGLGDLYNALDGALGELPVPIPRVQAEVVLETNVVVGSLSRFFLESEDEE